MLSGRAAQLKASSYLADLDFSVLDSAALDIRRLDDTLDQHDALGLKASAGHRIVQFPVRASI
jgi:hypothetical protein